MHILLSQPLEQIIASGSDFINAHINKLNGAIESCEEAISMYQETVQQRDEALDYIQNEYPKIRAEKERLEKELLLIKSKCKYPFLLDVNYSVSYNKAFHQGFHQTQNDQEKIEAIEKDKAHHLKVIENKKNELRAFKFRKEKLFKIMSDE